MPRWSRVLLIVAVVLVGAWFGYQTYLHVGDARATDERLDTVSAAWAAMTPAQRTAAATDATVRPDALGPEYFQQMGTTALAGHRAEGSTVVVAAGDGVCGATDEPTRWQAFVREGDDVVVVLVRPATSWLPDAEGVAQLLRPESCGGYGIEVPVRVRLAAPLGDRLLVDAGSGTASVGDRVSSGQVLEPQDG